MKGGAEMGRGARLRRVEIMFIKSSIMPGKFLYVEVRNPGAVTRRRRQTVRALMVLALR